MFFEVKIPNGKLNLAPVAYVIRSSKKVGKKVSVQKNYVTHPSLPTTVLHDQHFLLA